MQKVILFGGGDGGGLRITDKGVEPIPPFDPNLRFQFRALNNLARAGKTMGAKEYTRFLGDVVTRLSDSVLTQVEAKVGAIDANNGLIYQDEDGGFSCGSTGKPPIPFPWPVDPRKIVSDLIARDIIDVPTLNFLKQAAEKKLDVFTVARDPQAAAKKLDVALTPTMEHYLLALNPNRNNITGRVEQEVVEFYQQVVHDGRFASDLVANPAGVAEKLKLKISTEAIEHITATRNFGALRTPDEVMCPAAAGVAVAIVIVLWDKEAQLPVIDYSGVNKF